MTREKKIRNAVLTVFPQAELDTWAPDSSVDFKVYSETVTFEALEQLSKALSTKIININGGESGGGCETCGYGGGHIVEINVRDIPEVL